jgi:hypothetical protein
MEATNEKNFFILYKPKDIVSGDFYYALSHKPTGSNKELFYMCTADCTGHGVPGAFMSMLGISYLNESIIEKNISKPNEVLNNMREEIISSLNPEGSEEESKDGMDCCCARMTSRTFAWILLLPTTRCGCTATVSLTNISPTRCR